MTTKLEHGLYTALTTYHFLHDSLSETNPTDEGHSIFAVIVKESLTTVTKSYLWNHYLLEQNGHFFQNRTR